MAVTASTRSSQVQTIQHWQRSSSWSLITSWEAAGCGHRVSVCFRDANPEKLPLLQLVVLYQSHTGSTKWNRLREEERESNMGLGSAKSWGDGRIGGEGLGRVWSKYITLNTWFIKQRKTQEIVEKHDKMTLIKMKDLPFPM